MLVPALTCLLFSAQIQTSQVFAGSKGQNVLHMRSIEVDKVFDLAYGLQSKHLYTYARFTDGYHVKEWTAKGRRVADWKLPQTLEPLSTLLVYRGHLYCTMGDPTTRKVILLSLPSKSSEPITQEQADDSFLSKGALNPAVQTEIHRIMKQQHWYPAIQVGVDIGGPTDDLIDNFSVDIFDNRDYDQLIAWTSDYSVVSFAEHYQKTSSTFDLAVKQPDGSYQNSEVGSLVFDFLQWSRHIGTNVPQVKSMVVSSHVAVYGLEAEKDLPKHVVVWLTRSSSGWKPIRKEEGYLARLLENR